MVMLVVNGCTHRTDVSHEAFASNLNAKCFSAQKDLSVYFAATVPNHTYELISPELDELPWRTELAPWEKAFVIQKNEKLKITKIYDRAYGSSGHCWEIFAVRLKKPEVEFELPACWVEHVNDMWFKPNYPHKLKNDKLKLEIDTSYIKAEGCI